VPKEVTAQTTLAAVAVVASKTVHILVAEMVVLEL
jgi:hypothetical protein